MSEGRVMQGAIAEKRGSGQQSLCISSIAPGRAGAAKHRMCESGRPWKSDVGRYYSREVEQRTTPWMEEVEPRREQRSRSGCRDRVAPGAATESNAGDLQGKDCSQQSLCISTIRGGQMQEVRATHGAIAETKR